VTIRQIAKLSGVSIATVSRVVNGRSDVSSQTREAVQRVLREQGYPAGPRGRAAHPGAGARASTALVGVTMPLIHPGYFASILAGAAEALYEHDMRVVLCPTQHSRVREASLLERLTHGETEGAILVLPEESNAELQALASHGFRFVVVDPLHEMAAGIPVVSAANSSGATHATRHLLGLGHRRIAAVSGPRGWTANEERLRGYHAALAGAGVLPDPDLVVFSNFRTDGGFAAGEQLFALPDPPTAVFAFNDNMAIGVMQAARVRGLGVPGDVCVVGFDDTSEAMTVVPALTTVRQPLAEMGRTAVSLLLRQLENRRFEPLRVELETKLIVRDSTGPAPGPAPDPAAVPVARTAVGPAAFPVTSTPQEGASTAARGAIRE
jgi:LacI family transcriptional regulator, galactose operon repressor